jgi:hypothetical protein
VETFSLGLHHAMAPNPAAAQAAFLYSSKVLTQVGEATYQLIVDLWSRMGELEGQSPGMPQR